MENHKYPVSKTICECKNSDLIISYPDEDIMYDMFMMLRARKLQRMRYTCKQWIEVINSSRFINAHLRQSIPGVLAITRSALLWEEGNGYRYSDLVNIQIENVRNVSVSRFKVPCKKIVKSSCNGLLLLDDMPSVGRLIVANPVTNQFVELPPCTLWPKTFDIIRGITFLSSTGEYKVASLIYNETRSLSCEMLTLGSTFGKWKLVHSPFKPSFEGWLHTCGSVIIKGVIHFTACEKNDYMVMVGSRSICSFDTVGEKFYKSDMPAARGLTTLEVLHEIEGCPSIVVPNREDLELCQWDIWILKDLNIGEWHKLYSVNLIAYGYRYPQRWQYSKILATLDNGRFFIIRCSENDNDVYCVYDVQHQQLTSLKVKAPTTLAFIPYVESLVPCPNSS